jgi:hypothetical protein
MKKICTNCKKEKFLEDFYKRKIVPDGHCSECKECSKKRNKKVHRNHYMKNKERILEKNRKYLQTYKEVYKDRRNRRNKERLKTDIVFKLSHYLRRRINSAIKRDQRAGSAVFDLGCPVKFFKEYIETKFQDGMTWDNYGEWHLDHIRPLASFDLMDREQFLQAAHYTNYQPLWAQDNLRKSSKLILAEES